jgi:3-methylcrotonyl-CoA carboxylase alpha subunit
MFTTILIANRGEIACRVMRTARRMGIRTVAVYSSADEHARHVRLADEAVCIGPAAARESYLHIDRIVAAALGTGAQAVHPGYGFLSESAPFALACEQAGIRFIGPPAAAIRAMGSKSAAKVLLQAAGVPLTPGYHGDNQRAAFLAEEAQRIGYPVLIKASAGGGGKGMRRVDRPADFGTALAACQREAMASFASDHVLIEKYILQPRHIEVQVFADMHGNVVHLFERDCSVQRRHQKVLEEAPAPGMTAERRQAMGRAATQVARSVGYVGAGTVEFIAPRGEEAFFFMEMNTRLQVEHPVTEMITGLDLVEWQLRVAAGQALPRTQEQLAIRGHAIEARIYAEDADRGFTPATGTIEFLDVPQLSAEVRLDAGVDQGDAITPHYDPMIAKLIAWGVDRDAARARLRDALAQMRIVGVVNNLAFLARLVDAPSFASALLDTDLIERDAGALTASGLAPSRDWWLLAALAHVERDAQIDAAQDAQAGRHAGAWGGRDGWRANRPGQRTVQLVWLGSQGAREERQVRLSFAPAALVGVFDRGADIGDHRGARSGAYREAAGFGSGVSGLTFEGQSVRCRSRWDGLAGVDGGRLQAVLDGQVCAATTVLHAGRWHVFGARPGALARSHVHEVFECHDPLQETHGRSTGADEAHRTVLAPMPGKVIALLIEPGTQVARETPLLIVEAMKMEHTVRAPVAGLLRSFCVAVGDQVSMAEQLMEFEPETAAGQTVVPGEDATGRRDP